MAEPRTAYMHSPAPGNSRAYMGSILTIPVRGESTRGRLAVVEARARPGNEPPPHVHEWEDELFYVVEGSAEFYCGKDRHVAHAGDTVLIPQGVPHTMRFLTTSVRLIAVFSAVGEHPVGMDRYFVAMSEPATSLDLPAPGTATTYATAADPAHVLQLAAEHGACSLTLDETRELMPGYPGFGLQRR